MADEQSAFAALMDLVGQMNQQSEPGMIDHALAEIGRAKLSKIEIDRLLRGIRTNTGTTLTALREGLTEQRKKQSDGQADIPYLVMKKLLKEHFADGRYLIRGPDKSFWAYNGQHWQDAAQQYTDRASGAVRRSCRPYRQFENQPFHLWQPGLEKPVSG